MNITFSEGSGLNNSVFGNVQAPIRMFIEQHGEAHEQQSVLKNLFLMGKSENFGDTFVGMTAMEGFKPVGENGAYPQDGMQEGFSKFMQYTTWKDKFEISKEMIEDSKLLDLKKQPAAFMTAYGRTREKFGAALYGGAIAGNSKIAFGGMNFDTTTADGKPLFNIAHPSKIAKVKATQTNMFSNPFDVDALGRAEAAMHLFKGDNENILDVAPDTILIPESADLKKAVFAAVGSDKDPLTANNAFNYQCGRWTIIVWSFLNQFITPGSTPWILLDSKYNETYGGAIWNDRVDLEMTSYVDQNTDANVWNGRARWNACFNDWRYACVGGITGGTDLATLKV